MFLLLFTVWLILNGKVTWEICLFGAAISGALFYFMCRYMDYSARKELLLFRLAPMEIRYFWELVKEIVRANVCVLKIITSLDLQPEPALVYFDAHFRTGMAKAILANSITLILFSAACELWRRSRGSILPGWTLGQLVPK